MIARDPAAPHGRQVSAICDGCHLEEFGTFSPAGWFRTVREEHLCPFCVSQAADLYLTTTDEELSRVLRLEIEEEAP
jgi:hypothetical protein